MSPIVELPNKPKEAAAPSQAPRAGVIRDARERRQSRRRQARRAIAALGCLALAGGGLAVALTPGHPHRTGRDAEARRIALERLLQRESPPPGISPGLEGGSYGWEVHALSAGSCCTLPTRDSDGHEIGVATLWTSSKTREGATLLLADDVTALRAAGRSAPVTTLAPLPYGLKLAQVEFTARPGVRIFGEGEAPLLALGAGGAPLGYLEEHQRRAAARWWEHTPPAPAGPCRLAVHGLAGIRPQWGHIATRIGPYPGAVMGRAFFSCVDTEYYWHGWPLVAAILLDAQHPGVLPAALPGMRAIPGTRGLVDSPGNRNGEITARRLGSAWLIVAGGSGLGMRSDVLRHLRVTVALGGRRRGARGT